MRWQIEQYVFCDKHQKLDTGDKTLQLEPMVAELLSYFCQHPEKILSRDQLIEHVWLGRIVSDNAVNRIVTKLRKAFNDDAKNPTFIATQPKKGYKFIASVAPYKLPDLNISSQKVISPAAINSATHSRFNTKYIFFILSLTLIIFLMFNGFTKNIQKNAAQTLVKVKALTRDSGKESSPRASHDQQYLSYTEIKNQKMHLWIKSLNDETRVEINHGNANDTWVGPASWNKNSTKIVYLVTTPNSCEYFTRDIDGLKIGAPTLIHQCPKGSYGKIEFVHSDTHFIYTEAPQANAPYELFELNTLSGEKRKLPQPELVLGGNSQFDVHPTENKILISSPDEQQWEGFYSLDLETKNLKLLFKQDAFICCGIWDHTGKRVVLMGQHPAFELVSYDLNGKDPKVIYSGIHQLRSPHRHTNGIDYLFVSGHVNQNIHYLDNTRKEYKALMSASVDDRLAVLSNHGNQIAYVSLSSGTEEIWLSTLQGKQKRKLTRSNDTRHYFDLQWFPDDSKLIGVTLNEIYIIDEKTGIDEKLDLPQNEFKAVSVRDSKTIAFSKKHGEQWRIFFYDLQSNSSQIQSSRWQFVHFAPDSNDTLWIDKNGHVFTGETGFQQPLSTMPDIQDLLFGKVFSFEKLGKNITWQQFNYGHFQLFERNGKQPIKKLLKTDSNHFDLSAKGVFYHKIENANADIYTTIDESNKN
ncbi:winged helix-turn-helix domain-containing protein [Alteromonas sp. 5E99-2]|uniref:winged helix-turn-helix domain-containing protein n=1 Tax=Alteromonas sp. 5E99-2 TaxID=2817683 RepID=UPI001A984863|nr:transcriptional regulator [Alteromonas sp. 5E99-2]MBO1255966.1 winged helix-turn-helix domain-containing protein [Alteromonas sp. 5E99-2]